MYRYSMSLQGKKYLYTGVNVAEGYVTREDCPVPSASNSTIRASTDRAGLTALPSEAPGPLHPVVWQLI